MNQSSLVFAGALLSASTFVFGAAAQTAAGGSVAVGGSADAGAAAAPAPVPEAAPAPAPAPAAQVGVGLPAAQTAAVDGGSDHDAMSGHLAVGYLGYANIPLLAPGTAVPGAGPAVAAPVIGVRYWLNPRMGLDLGLGMRMGFGSSTVKAGGASQDVDNVNPSAFVVHAGIPLALSSAKHYSFQIIPELNLGYASVSQKAVGAGAGAIPELKAHNLHVDIGARAGAELHFGFMGVPQLSLQGSVGLRLNMESYSHENITADVKTTTSQTTIGTGVYDNPWNIFTSNVAAFYYF